MDKKASGDVVKWHNKLITTPLMNTEVLDPEIITKE
jgi:hypothetical protein